MTVTGPFGDEDIAACGLRAGHHPRGTQFPRNCGVRRRRDPVGQRNAADPLLACRIGPPGPPSPMFSAGSAWAAHPPALDPGYGRQHLEAHLRGPAEAVGASMFDIWLAPLRVAQLDAEELLLEAPEDTRAWVAERFGRVLQASAAAVLGPQVTVNVAGSVATSLRPRRRPRRAPDITRAPGSGCGGAARRRGAEPQVHLRPVRDRHRQPLCARRGAGRRREPGTAYNPLFLCAPRGRQDPPAALDRQLPRALRAGLRVRATTAEVFANEFIAALRAGGIDAFKARYRENDVC